MPDFFSYDPLNGVTTYFDFDEDTGTSILTKHQDHRPFVDYAAKVRSEGNWNKRLADDYGEQYAIIPTIVEMELLKKGINIHDPNCTKRLLEEINTNYPYLKLTGRNHVATS